MKQLAFQALSAISQELQTPPPTLHQDPVMHCQLCDLQNQSPQLKHADLILNLMRCIGASATAEDEKEEENQNSPAMLKKQRRYLLDPSGEEDTDLQIGVSGDMPAASGSNAATRKKEDGDAEMDWPIDAELFGVAEIAEMATLLLQIILELCGGSRSIYDYSQDPKNISFGIKVRVYDGRLGVIEVPKLLCLSTAHRMMSDEMLSFRCIPCLTQNQSVFAPCSIVVPDAAA